MNRLQVDSFRRQLDSLTALIERHDTRRRTLLKFSPKASFRAARRLGFLFSFKNFFSGTGTGVGRKEAVLFRLMRRKKEMQVHATVASMT